MSARTSTSWAPRVCSGAMYAGVPMISPLRVSVCTLRRAPEPAACEARSCSVIRARPKSSSRAWTSAASGGPCATVGASGAGDGVGCLRSQMFCGLMSRCRIPFWCA